jgi:hypothetical protein
MPAWQLGAMIVGGLAALLPLGFAFEALRARWQARHERRVAPGEDFALPPERVARVGDLRLSREGEELLARCYGEQRIRVDALPEVIDEQEIVLAGTGADGPVLRVVPWTGIRIRVDRADFSYADALAVEWPTDGSAPHRPFPKLVVTAHYVFDGRALRESGAPVWWAARRSIRLFIVEAATGRAWPSHSVQESERVRFTSMTGLHPSYAPEPGPPPGANEQLERIKGAVDVDLGPFIDRPAAPLVLKISAALGPYRSNEVQVTVRP